MIKPKMIIAHHGYAEIAPENTQLAFDAAHLFGFDGLKITLHQTKDEKLVLIRDESVDRTSKAHGQIQNMTLRELEKLNFAERFNKFFPKQIILTYKEFLKNYGNLFKIIDVELKTDVIHYPQIEAKVLEVGKEIRPRAQMIYSSTNLKTLKIMRELDPRAELGFIFNGKEDLEPIAKEVKNTCQYLHPWFNSLNNHHDLSYYQKLKMPLNVWTFDCRNTNDAYVRHSSKMVPKLKVMPEIMTLISNSKF